SRVTRDIWMPARRGAPRGNDGNRDGGVERGERAEIAGGVAIAMGRHHRHGAGHDGRRRDPAEHGRVSGPAGVGPHDGRRALAKDFTLRHGAAGLTRWAGWVAGRDALAGGTTHETGA